MRDPRGRGGGSDSWDEVTARFPVGDNLRRPLRGPVPRRRVLGGVLRAGRFAAAAGRARPPRRTGGGRLPRRHHRRELRGAGRPADQPGLGAHARVEELLDHRVAMVGSTPGTSCASTTRRISPVSRSDRSWETAPQTPDPKEARRGAHTSQRDARRRDPDRAGTDGLHRAGPARVGGVERGRHGDHRDVVGPARRGAGRDRQDARPHRPAVGGERRAAVRARPLDRRLHRRPRRALRHDLGR